jgi:hypothetical protein
LSAGDSLQPKQFFHGTDARLEAGDVIRPGSEIGRANFRYGARGWGGRNEHVFVTPAEPDAWMFAGLSTRSAPRAAPEDPDTWGSRPTVYEVEPLTPTRGSVDLPGGEHGNERITSAARVVRSIDIPPIPGRQGRLPPFNWGGRGLDATSSKPERRARPDDEPSPAPLQVPGQRRLSV